MKTAITMLITLGLGFGAGYLYRSKDLNELTHLFQMSMKLDEIEIDLLKKEIERLKKTDIQ